MSKKFLFKYSLFLLYFMGALSCTEQNASFGELDCSQRVQSTKVKKSLSLKLNDAEAIKNAKDFYSLLCKDNLRATKKLRIKNIQRASKSGFRATDSQNTNPLSGLLVVNFDDDKGYVLMSEDKRAEPLLAIAKEGSLNLEEKPKVELLPLLINAAQLSRSWNGYVCIRCGINPVTNSNVSSAGIEIPNDPTNEAGRFKQEQLCLQCKLQLRPQPQPIPIKEEEDKWEFVKGLGPLIQTEWGQSFPYNMELESIDGELPPAGCVPVALAQIMFYHKYPFYDLLKDVPTRANNLTNLETDYLTNMLSPTDQAKIKPFQAIAKVLYALGAQLNVSYSLDGSGARKDAAIDLFHLYGYTCSNLEEYKLSDILENLNDKKPVYIRGNAKKGTLNFLGLKIPWGYEDGHAWIIDGFVKYNKKGVFIYPSGIRTEYKREKELLHCNLGWNQSGNGYYISKLFDTNHTLLRKDKLRGIKTEGEDLNFQFNFNIIKNIKR